MNTTFARKLLSTALACAGALGASVGSADVSNLIVVRAANDTLWKSTCDGNTCSAFTFFPGLFGSQPAVSWDERQARYILTGTASNGTVWRSTFSPDGVFQNDWVQLAGLSASPPGAAGGGAARQWNAFFPTSVNDEVLTTDPAFTPRNILQLSFTPPFATGYYQCTGTAMASINRVNTAGTNVVYLGITDTSASFENNQRWTAVDLPTLTPIGLTTIPLALTVWFNASTVTSRTYYLVAQWAGSSSTDVITLRLPSMFCTYQPYTQ